MSAELPFSQTTGDDRRWRIESGARTLREYGELMNDPGLYEAAKKELESQIEESKKALGYAEMAKNKQSPKTSMAAMFKHA